MRDEQFTIRALEALSASKLVKWAPVASKGVVDVCLDVLRRLSDNKSPPDHLQSSTPFYRQFYHSLQYYVHEEPPAAGSMDAPEPAFGHAALLLRIPKIQAKHEEGEATIQDVESLLKWRHLLRSDEVAVLTAILKEIIATGAGRSSTGRHESKRSKKHEENKMDGIEQFFE